MRDDYEHFFHHYLDTSQIFEKYNGELKLNILEFFGFYDRFKKFSWGKIYLLLRILNNNKTEYDLEIASNIELLCLSAKLLDDFFDDDHPLSRTIEEKNRILLASELLIHSLMLLSKVNGFHSYSYLLHQSVIGEFNDLNLTIDDIENIEEDYRNNILKKTTAILQFICKVSGMNDEFSYQFSDSFGFIIQVRNDLKAIYNLKKSDLYFSRPTLPILFAFHSSSEMKKNEWLGLSQEKRQEWVRNSGSIEYCRFLLGEASLTVTELLRKHFDDIEWSCSDFENHLRGA